MTSLRWGLYVTRAIAVAAAILCGLLWYQALAHGPADWIRQGGYKNAVGQLCCGAKDCHLVPDENIAITAGGYLVKSSGEVVPFPEAQPSPDGAYWRCAWPTPAERKCFFAPPPAT